MVVQNYGYNAVDMVALQNSAGAVAVSDTMVRPRNNRMHEKKKISLLNLFIDRIK